MPINVEVLKNSDVVPANARLIAQLIDVVESGLHSHGLSIRKQEYAVQTEGNKLFATLVLERQYGDGGSFAIGLRTANDKSLALQMIAGLNIFVCDNMAFTGDVVTMTRKHTSGLNLQYEVTMALLKAVDRFKALGEAVTRLQSISLQGKDVFAKSKVLDAALTGIIPLRLIPDIWNNYTSPKHEDFAPRNAWSLHNAFTESFKLLRPNIAMQANVELGKLFQV